MHVEQNDGLRDKNRLATQRYSFAVKCLEGRNLIVADAGCGYGYGTFILTKAGHTVVGIDNNKGAIEYAEKNYPGDYLVLDIEKRLLNGYEVIVCLECLCHLKSPKDFIKNIKSKELIISAPIDPSPSDGYKWRLHNLSEIQFKDLLKDWKIIEELWQGGQQRYLTLHCKKI